MFKELNSKRTIREGISLTDLPFVKLRDLEGHDIKVDGYFFTDGDYGKQLVIVGNGLKINMPGRSVKQFEDIDRNDEMVDAILNGHLMITNIREGKTKRGTTTLYDLEDC